MRIEEDVALTLLEALFHLKLKVKPINPLMLFFKTRLPEHIQLLIPFSTVGSEIETTRL